MEAGEFRGAMSLYNGLYVQLKIYDLSLRVLVTTLKGGLQDNNYSTS